MAGLISFVRRRHYTWRPSHILLLMLFLNVTWSAQREQEVLTDESSCPQDAFSALQVKTSYQRRSGVDTPPDKMGGWQGIQIVGAGLSRTGTTSLAAALKILGHHPIHGFDKVGSPVNSSLVGSQALLVLEAFAGNMTDLLAALAAEQIDSVLDSPGRSFTDEFVARYNSKVILSVHPRGADGWVDSVQRFARFWPIYNAFPAPPFWALANGSTSCVVQVSPTLTIDSALREKCKQAYNEYNANIIKRFPPDRLLVYSVASHWGPLVKFLGQSIPTKAGRPIPFPHYDNVALKIGRLKECGFCDGQVNGHKPMPSDVNLIPPEVSVYNSGMDESMRRHLT